MKNLKLIIEALETKSYIIDRWKINSATKPVGIGWCKEYCAVWFNDQPLKYKLEQVSINTTSDSVDGVEWVIDFLGAVREYESYVGYSMKCERATATLLGQDGGK